MNSAYRGAQPCEDSEPLPNVSKRQGSWRDSAVWGTLLVLAIILEAHTKGVESAVLMLVLTLPTLVAFTLILVLGPSIDAWRARRDARLLVRGIAELEAKAARL